MLQFTEYRNNIFFRPEKKKSNPGIGLNPQDLVNSIPCLIPVEQKTLPCPVAYPHIANIWKSPPPPPPPPPPPAPLDLFSIFQEADKIGFMVLLGVCIMFQAIVSDIYVYHHQPISHSNLAPARNATYTTIMAPTIKTPPSWSMLVNLGGDDQGHQCRLT